MKNRHPVLILVSFVVLLAILACSNQPAPNVPPTATAISMTSYTDETGVITVSLPSEWTDVDGSDSYSNSTKVSQLVATTNMEKFNDYSGPGIVIWVARTTAKDPKEMINLATNKASSIFFEASCKKFYDHTYYDRVYDGKKQMFNDCNNFDNILILLVSRLAKTDVVVSVTMNLSPGVPSSEADALFKSILASLKVDSSLVP